MVKRVMICGGLIGDDETREICDGGILGDLVMCFLGRGVREGS